MTFTCGMGTFVFEDDAPLSIAKLIRNMVMGQWFAPKPGEKKLHSEQDCYDFIASQASARIQEVPFTVILR